MANEITIQTQMRLVNGELLDNFASSTVQIDQNVPRLVRNVQNIGLTEEPLDTGDVITPGYATFANLDVDNFVEVGSYVGGVFYPFIKVMPEDYQTLRLAIPNAELYARADTAAVEIFYIIYND